MKKLVSYGVPLIAGMLLCFLYSTVYHSEWYTKSAALAIITLLQTFHVEHLIAQLPFPEASLVLDLVRAVVLSSLFTTILVLLTVKLKILAHNSQLITLGVLLACITELVSPIIILTFLKQGALESLQELNLTLFERLPVTVASWYLPLVVLVLFSMMVVRIKT